jgi:hypothetical protein
MQQKRKNSLKEQDYKTEDSGEREKERVRKRPKAQVESEFEILRLAQKRA